MRGELAVILTAMRNRALQKVEEDLEDDDSDDDFEDDDQEEEDQDESEAGQEKKVPEFLFKNEKRFPVCKPRKLFSDDVHIADIST